MDCPNCQKASLKPVPTRQGVVVDRCENCGGIWLDRGEIFLFAKNPGALTEALKKAFQTPRAGVKPSPISGEPMDVIDYLGSVELNHCFDSGGLWIDHAKLRELLKSDPELKLEPDRRYLERPERAVASASQALLALPNLALRSTLTLAGLYILLTLGLIIAAEIGAVGLEFAVGGAFVIILVQFLIGPFIMDLTLRWLYRMKFLELDEVPVHLAQFMAKVCNDQDVSVPRLGLIDDGGPQAFTYGHVPGNARIVISRGLLELLEEAEVEAVVAHEIGHAVHWDMLLMTMAQMVPMLFYYLYRSLIRAARSGKSKKGGGGAAVIAIGAYVLYIVTEYAVLWFSRTREYHADRFSGEVTGKPALLASALAKIAYGLAGATGESAGEGGGEAARSPKLEAIGALGIFDSGAAG